MFSLPLDTIFLSIGGITILLIRFYIDKKKWYWFVTLAILSIYTGFQVKNVIILKDNKLFLEYTTFYSTYHFTFQNGSSKNLKIRDNVLINDSKGSVIVEKVFYSANGGTIDENPFVTTINSFDYNNNLPKIDYIFEDPPQTISEKKGIETKAIYWLHY